MKSSFAALTCLISAGFLLGCASIDTKDADRGEIAKDQASSVGQPHKDINLSTRTYDGNSWDIANEIKAFYLQLLESNENIKSQYDSLTQRSRDENGGIFHTFEPQVVEWIPSEQSWNAMEEFKSVGNYLVIQPIGYGRSRRAGYDAVIISEFSVNDSGTVIEESRKDLGRDPMSTTTKITFLGFRNLQISPANQKK